MSENNHFSDVFTSEQRFQLLVESVQDYAIYLLDPSGAVCSWNSGAERIKGYRAEEVLGRHVSLFYPENERQGARPRHALSTAAEQGRYEEEGWRVRKDGSRFLACVVLQAIHDANGTLVGYAEITRDITQRRLTRQTLEQVDARLLQAQKMEALRQLTGRFANDFNNALSVIIGSLDLLAGRLRSNSDSMTLEKALRAGERASVLTRQLLAFARCQALSPEIHDLNALIQDSEAAIRHACGARTEVQIHYGPDLPTVLVDKVQFENALLNLVMNAQDAMPDGGSLTITTAMTEVTHRQASLNLEPGFYITVIVGDTGVGMPPDVVRRAVEPFFSMKESELGKGLGLSQAHGFVTQSGGSMLIESVVAKGTSIALYFPVSVKLPLEPPPRTPENSRGKALIVEDDLDVLDVSRQIFESLGYEVLTAGNGMDAVDILQRVRDINLLFTDVVMPMGLSGIALARFTRKVCPNVQILIASGYPLNVLTEEYGNLDGFDFLSKPFRWNELLEKIGWLEAQRDL